MRTAGAITQPAYPGNERTTAHHYRHIDNNAASFLPRRMMAERLLILSLSWRASPPDARSIALLRRYRVGEDGAINRHEHLAGRRGNKHPQYCGRYWQATGKRPSSAAHLALQTGA